MIMITAFVVAVVRLLEFLLFARAIFSWFPQSQGTKLYEFLYMATEPIILPFRKLLSHFEFIRTMPLDISFLCAVLVLEIVMTLLGAY